MTTRTRSQIIIIMFLQWEQPKAAGLSSVLRQIYHFSTKQQGTMLPLCSILGCSGSKLLGMYTIFWRLLKNPHKEMDLVYPHEWLGVYTFPGKQKESLNLKETLLQSETICLLDVIEYGLWITSSNIWKPYMQEHDHRYLYLQCLTCVCVCQL